MWCGALPGEGEELEEIDVLGSFLAFTSEDTVSLSGKFIGKNRHTVKAAETHGRIPKKKGERDRLCDGRRA